VLRHGFAAVLSVDAEATRIEELQDANRGGQAAAEGAQDPGALWPCG
jgi:hypothetical protein